MKLLHLSLLVLSIGAVDGAEPALVLHGGAGTLDPATLGAELEQAIREDLANAYRRGWALLADGASASEVALAVVTALEDSAHFNAGKGAVYTADGGHELDAAIIDSSGRAGAVAGIRTVANPIVLAEAVRAQTPHVLLIAEGAEALARELGFPTVAPDYFDTERRRLDWERMRSQPLGQSVDHSRFRAGTVGVVVRDKAGLLVAATSTGGMTNKRRGRVGDSPLIGAGTYASPGCAVSATGWGELFIRHTVARDVCARRDWLKQSLAEAAQAELAEVKQSGGDGGLIALDDSGQGVLIYNSRGMYRAYLDTRGNAQTAIVDDAEDFALD